MSGKLLEVFFVLRVPFGLFHTLFLLVCEMFDWFLLNFTFVYSVCIGICSICCFVLHFVWV